MSMHGRVFIMDISCLHTEITFIRLRSVFIVCTGFIVSSDLLNLLMVLATCRFHWIFASNQTPKTLMVDLLLIEMLLILMCWVWWSLLRKIINKFGAKVSTLMLKNLTLLFSFIWAFISVFEPCLKYWLFLFQNIKVFLRFKF